MSEPKVIHAGSSVTWSRQHDAAVEGVTAIYRFLGRASRFNINTEAEDGEFFVSISSAITSDWTSGEYKWFLLRTDNDDKNLLDTGYLTVEANPLALNGLDTRTFAERMLSAIEAKLEGRLSSDHERYSIDGRSLDRIPFVELEKLRTKYAWQVHDERVKKKLVPQHKSVRHI